MILIFRSTRFLMETSIGLDEGCTHKMMLQEKIGATTPYMRVVPPVLCPLAMCKAPGVARAKTGGTKFTGK